MEDGRDTGRRSVLLLLFVGCAACAPTPPVLAGGVRAGPDTKGGLSLVDISPRQNDDVAEDTVVRAALEYSVEDFRAGDFFVAAVFEGTKAGVTTDGDYPKDKYLFLTEPRGRVTVEFPLRYVWRKKDVKKPLVAWFLLLQMKAPGNAHSIARTGPARFAPQP